MITQSIKDEIKSLWMQGYCIRSISNKLGVTQKTIIRAIEDKSQFDCMVDDIKEKNEKIKEYFNELCVGETLYIVTQSNRNKKGQIYKEKIVSKQEYFLLTDKKRTIRIDEILTGYIKINNFIEIAEIKMRIRN